MCIRYKKYRIQHVCNINHFILCSWHKGETSASIVYTQLEWFILHACSTIYSYYFANLCFIKEEKQTNKQTSNKRFTCGDMTRVWWTKAGTVRILWTNFDITWSTKSEYNRGREASIITAIKHVLVNVIFTIPKGGTKTRCKISCNQNQQNCRYSIINISMLKI